MFGNGNEVILELGLDSKKFNSDFKKAVNDNARQLEKLDNLATDKLSKSLGISGKSALELKRALIGVNKTNFSSIVSSASKLDKEVGTLSKSFSGLKRVARGALTGLGFEAGRRSLNGILSIITAIPRAIGGIVGSSSKAFQEFESLNALLQATSGSTEKAAQQMSFLASNAEKFKIPILESAQAYTQFSIAAENAGFAQEQTNRMFEQFSQGARVYGLSADEMGNATRALTQMLSKETVQAEELKGQLAEALPGAYNLAAEALGISTQELGKKLKDGEVLASDLIPKLLGLLETKTADGLAASLATTNARMAAVGNQLLLLKVSFGEAISPAFVALLEGVRIILDEIGTDIFDSINAKAEEFRDFLADNPEVLQEIGQFLETKILKLLENIAVLAGNILEYLTDADKQAELEEWVGNFNEGMEAVFAIAKGILDTINLASEAAERISEIGPKIGNPGSAAGGWVRDRLTDTDITGELIKEAKQWGKDFKEGVEAQCAYFVREVFKEVGIDLGAGSGTGRGFADSLLSSSIGEIKKTSNPKQIPQGAIVFFENTYGNFDPGTITHAGIATGNGEMVDRSTASAPVKRRSIGTFSQDEYTYVIPKQLRNPDYKEGEIGEGFTSSSQKLAARRTASNSELFSGGTESLVIRAIGVSEGTRTRSGGYTDAYQSHTDPGNSATNVGSFSAQNEGWTSPEQADAAWLDRLENKYLPMFKKAAKGTGLENNEDVILNFLDLAVQSPEAATDRGGFLDQLGKIAKAGATQQSILDARMQAYVDPRDGIFKHVFGRSGGEADQRRRMEALKSTTDGGGSISTALTTSSSDLSNVDTTISAEDTARDAEDAAKKAKSAREEAEREAKRVIDEANALARDARSAVETTRDAATTAAYQADDARIQAARKSTESKLDLLEATNQDNDYVTNLVNFLRDKNSIYDSVSDEVVQNNRAAAELQKKIDDELTKSTYGEDVNNDLVEVYRKQLASLGEANKVLRTGRTLSLDILSIKDKEAFAIQRANTLLEQRASLQESEYNIALGQNALDNSRIYDEEELLRKETSTKFLELDSQYTPQIDALAIEQDELTKKKGILDSLIATYPELADELKAVNEDLAFVEQTFNNLNEEMSLAKGLAGVDLERFLIDKKDLAYNDRAQGYSDYQDEFRTRGRESAIYEAERNGSVFEGNAVRRNQGTADIGAKFQADIARVSENLSGGELTAAVEALFRLKELDLSSLQEQTQTLGESIEQDLNQGFKSFVESVLSGTQTAGEALLSFLSQIGSQLLSYGLDGLFGSSGGGGELGGIGGAIMSLFAADGHIPNYATGNPGGILQAAVKEGQRMPGGASLVMANSSEAILNTGQQRALANSLTNRGGASNVVNTVNINNTGPDLNPMALKQIKNALNAETDRKIAKASKSQGMLNNRGRR